MAAKHSDRFGASFVTRSWILAITYYSTPNAKLTFRTPLQSQLDRPWAAHLVQRVEAAALAAAEIVVQRLLGKTELGGVGDCGAPGIGDGAADAAGVGQSGARRRERARGHLGRHELASREG